VLVDLSLLVYDYPWCVTGENNPTPLLHIKMEVSSMCAYYSEKVLLVRRFVVDNHDGKEYYNYDINLYEFDGERKSDEEVLKYVREKSFKTCRRKVWSITEIMNDEVTLDMIKEAALGTPAMRRNIMKYLRRFYYDPMYEQLSAYEDIPIE
jgi:hypothetical protein